MPRREFHAAEAAIRHFGADCAPSGIVINNRRDAYFLGFFELMPDCGCAEIRFVLFDRFAFVVEDGLAVGDPA